MVVRLQRFLDATCRPAALFVLVGASFGLPLNGWPAFLALSFAAVAALVGTIRTGRRRWAAACAVAATCVVLRAVLPVHQIDEGHAVFSSEESGPLAAALPADVFAGMRQLQQALPKRFEQKPPARAWAFSADGVWKSSPLSRARDGIDFGDRWSLRVGTMNDILYNDRREGLYLPLVFRFDLPDTVQGARLCWMGTLYWPDGEGLFTEASAEKTACRDLPRRFDPRESDGRPVLTIYAADFDPARPLAMRLDRTGIRDHTPVVATLAGIAGALTVLGLLVRVRAAAVASWSIAVLSIVAYIAQRTARGEPPAYSGLPFLGRGNDGLTFYSQGRSVLANLVEGNWGEALRGGSDIFYFGPGMRYAWAALTGFFGDSFFGYFIVITILPFLVLYLLRAYAGPKSAILLFWCFLLVPVFEALGFFHWYYVKLAVRGFGGALGWSALFAGVLLLVRRFDLPDARGGGLFAAGLFLALAISCRPNLAVGVIVLVAGAAFLLLRDGRLAVSSRLWDVALLGLGSSAALAIPLHNWYFGGIFVPLTQAWDVEANLQFAPSNYVDAAVAVFAGDPSWPAKVARVLKQVRGWIKYYEFWLLIPYISLWVAAFRRDFPAFLRLLALSLIACHVVFLFYPGFPRYGYGIWLLTFLVFMAVLRHVYWPAARRRWPRLVSLREPAWLGWVSRLDPVVGKRSSPAA